jgi:integrase
MLTRLLFSESDSGQDPQRENHGSRRGYAVLDHPILVGRAAGFNRPPNPDYETNAVNPLAHLSTSDLSESVVQVMRLDKKPRTIKAYTYQMKHYLLWCQQRNLDPQTTTWKQRVEYLAYVAETTTLATRSIANLRTAISVCTPLVDGQPFEALPKVQTFIKGLTRRKPIPVKFLLPKWNVTDLIHYLQALPPWEELALVQKGQKTHALLCIATGWRPSSDFARTLASVDFEFSAGPDWSTSMVLTAVDVKEGGDKCSLEIPRLLEDQALCPTLAAFRYLQDTRTVRSDEAIFLFVAAVPPHGNLTADRLRNWFKSTMTAAGIPDQFTPHTVRAVTTWTAFDAGTPLEDIVASANWSTSTTFEGFYHLHSPQASAPSARAARRTRSSRLGNRQKNIFFLCSPSDRSSSTSLTLVEPQMIIRS